MIDSAILGKLKLEHKFKEGIFVMPKVYYLELDDGTVISKVKGFPGKLTKAQYLELLEGNSLDLQITKWNRSLKLSTIQIQRGIPYVLKLLKPLSLRLFLLAHLLLIFSGEPT
jgi:hypothetical protein